MDFQLWSRTLEDAEYRVRILQTYRTVGSPILEVIIYGPEGHLLTSAMAVETRSPTGKPEGLGVYWLRETISTAEDLKHLAAINDRRKAEERAAQTRTHEGL